MIKLKAFADDTLNATQMTISVFDRLENIVGKEENAGYQHFLLFTQCFQKASFWASLKVGIVWKRVKHLVVFNPLPHNMILDKSKVKPFADVKMNMAEKIYSFSKNLNVMVAFFLTLFQTTNFRLPD